MRRKWITFLRIVQTGALNFIRNLSLAVAAMAVMVVTLTIVLASVITNATFGNTIEQITDRIDISVFLKDEVNQEQADELLDQLRARPDVERVTFYTKEEALQRYLEQNAGNEQLLAAVSATDNPIPATVVVKPRDINQLQAIRDFLNRPENLALQSDQSSDNSQRREAVNKITHATNVMRQAGVISVMVFAVICALIIFNTIQMAIFNRRDELTIMRLLGASTSYIRGPFVVESAIYGILSAIISILLVNGAFLAASNALQATSLGLLDINYAQEYFSDNFLKLLTMQLAVGIVIGTVSSIIATRRYLKFKVR